MKVLLTGATGFVGSRLTQKLTAAGHTVLPVSRSLAGAYDWSDAGLARGVAEADAVVNLAGENLFEKRWTASQKGRLHASRVAPTKRLAELVAARRPVCFISASAIGFYGSNETDALTETAPPGSDFLATLCREWESATEAAASAGVRTVIVRLGVVLGARGGALAKMLLPFRLGLGGPLGSGRQWFSWIHLEDVTALLLFLLENNACVGAHNATAPNPVTMKELAKALGRALHRPAVMPVPAFALRLALGEGASAVLTGQKVLPARAAAAGFQFRFGDVDAALTDILGVSRR